MKKFIIGFLVFFGVLFLGAAIFIFTFDINTYKSQIENALRDATGYSFSLKGKVTASRSFEPIVEVTDVEIKNGTGFKEPLLFSAKRAQISLDLKSLLKDVIIIHAVRLSDVNVNLEVSADGNPNWLPAKIKTQSNEPARPALTKAAAKSGKKTANVASLSMVNMNVGYANVKTAENLKLLFPRLSIEQLLNFKGEVVYKNEKFLFSGSVKNLLAMLATQKNLNFSFDVESSLFKGNISGVCRDLKECKNDMTLNLNTSGDNLQKAYAFFMGENKDVLPMAYEEQSAIRLLKSTLLMEGSFSLPKNGVKLTYNIEQNLSELAGKGHVELDVTGKKVAHLYGIEPVSLKANYVLSANKVLDISNITAMFDETDIDGAIKIAFDSAKPKVEASLHSHYFKLSNVFYTSKVSANKSKKKKANSSEKLFSDEAFDLHWLKQFDGALAMNIDNLGCANAFLRYPQVFLNARLNDSVLTLTLNEGSSFAEGGVVGKAILNSKKEVPSLDVALVAQDLKLNQVNLLKNVFRSGDLGTNLFLKSSGNSVASLLGNLNGSALFVINQVDIFSPIISGLVSKDNYSMPSRAAEELFIKCAVLNATIQNGKVLLSQKAALETGKFNMIIDGDINLKNETLNLHFIPQSNNKTQGKAFNAIQAVALKGSLSNPVTKIEADVAELFPVIMPQKVSEKQAFLDSYTKKVVEDNSVCRTAMGTSVFKTIDSYFGRDLIKEEVKEEAPVEEPEEITRAEKIGLELLDSLSDVLSNANDSNTAAIFKENSAERSVKKSK